MSNKSGTVITFGTYDLFHVGHLNILRRAALLGNRLIVGISTDELNFRKKRVYPAFSEDDRVNIVSAIRFVDHVFLEESLEKKREYILKYNAEILVMGNDWEGRFDEYSDICSVIYLPRTEGISTTEVKYKISANSL